MAGYPKIWTRIRHRPWFRELGLAQRGIWYEVIMIAKEQTDDGWICFSNASGMASELHTNRTSIETWIARESHAERISNVQKGKSCLRFYISEYNNSQQVSSIKEFRNRPLKGREGKQKEREGNNISPAPPDLAEKRISDGTHGDKCDAIVTACKSYLGLGCSHAQAGQINKKAESVGQAIVAISRIRSWIDKGITTKRYFMGAVIRDLQQSRGSTDKDGKRHPGWPDADWEMVKSENERFEKLLDQKYGNKLGDVITRMKGG